ncbi:MAG: hypothetical protein HY744_23440 [Deltaproteobacteria bacterium]|nr:hypothetical protein [Deltaproteobacteria bacterium]
MLCVVLLAGCGGDVETTAPPVPGELAACGPVACPGNQYCCDPACGRCVEQGVACPEPACE